MLVALFSEFKDVLSSTLHLSRDALHVHIGLLIFLSAAMLLRGPRRFRTAFLALLALCLVGELADVVSGLSDFHGPHWRGGVKDVINTMFWPGMWLLAWPHVGRMLRPAQGFTGTAIGRTEGPDRGL